MYRERLFYFGLDGAEWNEKVEEIEQTGVCLSGEKPINKEADKQIGQLSITLYQSEASPRYKDVVQAKA